MHHGAFLMNLLLYLELLSLFLSLYLISYILLHMYLYIMITDMVWSQMYKILMHIASLCFMSSRGYVILYLKSFVSRIIFIFVGQ